MQFGTLDCIMTIFVSLFLYSNQFVSSRSEDSEDSYMYIRLLNYIIEWIYARQSWIKMAVIITAPRIISLRGYYNMLPYDSARIDLS